jgi:multicomponent Na+:H+ antiporter subunit B
MIPVIQLFGIYVVVHGHLSPGGGFAGGTIWASASFCTALCSAGGLRKSIFAPECSKALIGGGLTTVRCLMKGYSFISGGSHMGWPMPRWEKAGSFKRRVFAAPQPRRGVIVAVTMYFFYTLFVEGGL